MLLKEVLSLSFGAASKQHINTSDSHSVKQHPSLRGSCPGFVVCRGGIPAARICSGG